MNWSPALKHAVLEGKKNPNFAHNRVKHVLLKNEIIQNIFQPKTYNEDSKKITQKLINNHFDINSHNNIMNETDRTIVGLLWHENIVDVLGKVPIKESFPFYNNILENICFSDYIDRITFQKQIWQFNEMSSLIKTFKNNKLYHDSFNKKQKQNLTEIRFTKVLTKYSTEYNNNMFISSLCQSLNMERSDIICFFEEIRQLKNMDPSVYFDIESKLNELDINKLDIRRVYRYLDKNAKQDTD